MNTLSNKVKHSDKQKQIFSLTNKIREVIIINLFYKKFSKELNYVK